MSLLDGLGDASVKDLVTGLDRIKTDALTKLDQVLSARINQIIDGAQVITQGLDGWEIDIAIPPITIPPVTIKLRKPKA